MFDEKNKDIATDSGLGLHDSGLADSSLVAKTDSGRTENSNTILVLPNTCNDLQWDTLTPLPNVQTCGIFDVIQGNTTKTAHGILPDSGYVQIDFTTANVEPLSAFQVLIRSAKTTNDPSDSSAVFYGKPSDPQLRLFFQSETVPNCNRVDTGTGDTIELNPGEDYSLILQTRKEGGFVDVQFTLVAQEGETPRIRTFPILRLTNESPTIDSATFDFNMDFESTHYTINAFSCDL